MVGGTQLRFSTPLALRQGALIHTLVLLSSGPEKLFVLGPFSVSRLTKHLKQTGKCLVQQEVPRSSRWQSWVRLSSNLQTRVTVTGKV